jgi:hypothetical protein
MQITLGPDSVAPSTIFQYGRHGAFLKFFKILNLTLKATILNPTYLNFPHEPPRFKNGDQCRFSNY